MFEFGMKIKTAGLRVLVAAGVGLGMAAGAGSKRGQRLTMLVCYLGLITWQAINAMADDKLCTPFLSVFNSPIDGNIPNGTIGFLETIDDETQVNVRYGGSIGRFVETSKNASRIEVNIFGGTVGNDFGANSGSMVNISGGSIAVDFKADIGSKVNFSGGEFKLNGLNTNLPNNGLVTGDVFTGTLADGSVFIFSESAGDSFAAGTTTLNSVSLNPPDLTPIAVASGLAPSKGLRVGQTLTLGGTATLRDNFAAVGATLNIEGGTVGSRLEIANSTVNITGGSVGFGFAQVGFAAHSNSTVNISGRATVGSFSADSGSVVNISGGFVGPSADAYSGSTVNISGGRVGLGFAAHFGSTINISGGKVDDNFDANDGSVVNISGGSIGRLVDANRGSLVNISGGTVGVQFDANRGSTVNISGGAVDRFFRARFGSTVNINGGSVGDLFSAESNSTVNLFGTEFLLNGKLLDTLEIGEALTITQRNVSLSGLLTDGSPFSFNLFGNRSSTPSSQDFFSPNAMLTVTLVSEPTTWLIALFGLFTFTGSRKHCSHSP